jgi:hypothetical protein
MISAIIAHYTGRDAPGCNNGLPILIACYILSIAVPIVGGRTAIFAVTRATEFGDRAG